ncbi:MAG: hypothetical protein HY360_10455 [Verrucomicrobia bacterium]|nr:hypothetical protein [Verrucomicrobiota bacterium]
MSLVPLLTLHAQTLAEFSVGPAPVAVRDWTVATTINLKDLAAVAASKEPLDSARLEMVEALADGKLTPPVVLQVSRWIAPWQGQADLRTLHWQLPGETPKGATRNFRLQLHQGSKPAIQNPQPGGQLVVEENEKQTTVANRFFEITHDRTKGFGISSILYQHNKIEVPVLMGDEIFTPKVDERKPVLRMWNTAPLEATVLEEGPLRLILEAKVRFSGTITDKTPEAVYWYAYHKDSPLVGLYIWFPQQDLGDLAFDTATVARFLFEEPHAFLTASAGDPLVEVEFKDTPASIPLSGRNVSRYWSCLIRKDMTFGLIGDELGQIYGAKKGQQIAGNGWRNPWRGEDERWQGHFYAGPAGTDGLAVRIHADLMGALQPRLKVSSIRAQGDRLLNLLRDKRKTVKPGTDEAAVTEVVATLTDLAMESMKVGTIGRVASMLNEANRLLAERGKDAAMKTPFFLSLGEGGVLANHKIGIYFWKSEAGYCLCGIKNPKLNHQFLRPKTELAELWKIKIRSADRKVESAVGPLDAQGFRVDSQREGNAVVLKMRWEGCRPKQTKTSINVTVTVTLDSDSSLSKWRIHADAPAEEMGLWTIDFPIIPGVGKMASNEETETEEYIAAAMKQGVLFPSPSKSVNLGGEKYPGQYMFQFLDYWRGTNNLYLAAYDPKACTKDFFAKTDAPGSFAMGIRHDPPYMAVPGKPFATDYDCVVGTFAGDWYDASKVYREWGTKQVWCSKGTIDQRKDIPAWLKNNCLTLRPGDRPPKGTEVLVKAREALPDLPMMAIWYDYVASTNMYDFCPEMKPAVPEFTPAVKSGMGLNIPSLAFMHAFLWGGMDPDFQRVAVPNAVVKENGAPMIDKYMHRDVAYMDPGSEAWQQKLAQVLVGLVKDHGVKGAYMDLLGCGPFNNFRAVNGRHPSGGDYWANGHRALMKYLRESVRRVEPEFVMLAENPAEPYLDLMDAGTMFGGVNPDLTPLNIPMLQTIYGDYLIQYGPKSAGVANSPREALLPIQTFIYGCQLGRLFLWDDKSTDGQLFPKLAQYRQASLPYFVGAEVLRPLPIKYLTDSHTDLQKMDLAILRTVRRAPDGNVALMFGNTTFGTKMKFSFTIDPKQLGFDDTAKLTIERVTPKGRTPSDPFSGKQERTEELNPMEVLVLVIKKDKDRT